MRFRSTGVRTMVAAACLFPVLWAQTACDKSQSSPAPAPGSASTAVAQAASDAAAPVTPQETKDAWYPEGTKQKLRLTWAVYPPKGPKGGDTTRNLEVIARIGDAVRRVMIGPERGDLEGADQSVCTASLKTGSTVSVLKFQRMGGPKTFYAKRTEPTVLEISYFVDSEPEERAVVAKIPIPADATISDAVSDILGAGNEGPLNCATGSTGFPSAGAVLKVDPKAKNIDTSDWKSAPAGSTLSLRWTADQSRSKPSFDPKGPSVDRTKIVVPLDLVLTLNGRRHAVSFQTNAGGESSDKCGEISFYWADITLPFELRRAEGGKAVITRAGQQVYAFDLPKDVKVTQELIVIDPKGKRTSDTKCTPKTL